MYDGDEAAYFGCGKSALRCIRHAMLAMGKEEASAILDFPCGHGRVLRMLKAAFPEAALTACDIDRDGVDFCARAFGAAPIYSDRSPEHLEIADAFDLIWCGSLLTHLDSFRWEGFLSLFERSLAETGLLVFTTHGRTVADQLSTSSLTHFARPVVNMTDDYHAYGFGYSDYYDAPREYGVSLSSPAWVCSQLAKLPGLRLVSFTEAAWDSSQDVIACAKDHSSHR
jgi:SAM-dependent methyltransferase